MMTTKDALYLGLGGNVGGDTEILARFAAVARAVAPWGEVRASRVYRTAPVGPDQPDFLNAALEVQPGHAHAPSPTGLAAWLLDTERALGRDRAREQRWGPRPIDIDLLLWGPHFVR